MQKLHPKAIWLFFFSFIWRIMFLYVFSIMFSVQFFSMKHLTKNFGGWEQLTVFTGPLFFNLLTTVLIFLAPIIIAYIWACFTYRFYRYQLADGVIKIEKGVILKKYISIPYERIQNIDIYRGIIARILKLSDLHIQTAGYSGSSGNRLLMEGRLPGLDIQTAEKLREDLIIRIRGTKQGL